MTDARKILLVSLLIKITPIGWALTFIACLFIKWDKTATPDSKGSNPTIRGDLPKWLSWLATPDERFPGGTYEPTVLEKLKKYGKFLTSWYWITWRNAGHGYRKKFAKPSDEASYNVRVKLLPGETLAFGTRQDGTVWRLKLILWGKFVYQTGSRVYKFVDGSYWSIPTETIKRHKND